MKTVNEFGVTILFIAVKVAYLVSGVHTIQLKHKPLHHEVAKSVVTSKS